MDAFSSSLFSTLQHPNLLSPTKPTTSTISSPHVHTFNVSSVNIEEKPQNTTPTPRQASIPKTDLFFTKTVSATSSTKTKSPSRPENTKPISSHSTTSRSSELSLLVTIFNSFDDLINTFIDPPLRPSVDPKRVLTGNFAPVDELPPTECLVIQGELPSCLDGAYIRNGPNPQYCPRGPYHLFDGDGMLHSLRISRGRTTLCSRYVKTYKYNIEREAGSPVLPNVFSGFHSLKAAVARGVVTAARVLTGVFNPKNGIGLANTSLAFFGNRLFALGESDLPYAIQLTPDGDIETIGRWDCEGELVMSMTAHPKIDADTGETFAFRYGPMPPFLTFFRFDPNGSKQQDVPVFSMVRSSFLHDFAITKKYAIFADIQMGMNPLEMIMKGGSPFVSDLGKVPRIGVIPRYAKDESEMRWFEVLGLNIIHAINAWDEEDALVLIAPNILSVEHSLERMELIHASLEKVRIDLKTGIVSRFRLSARNLDFGVINPSFVGKKSRYVYMGVGDPMPTISGVVKVDVLGGEQPEECTVACRTYGAGCYGGEPFFVARDPNNTDAAKEDDGYVVSYVHDENSGESRFLVMDAKSPSLDIVAAVKLPRRVPYGFHGLFIKETDLTRLL